MSLISLFVPADSCSVKYEMHICYYFAQIVLYRPFLHYLTKEHDDDPVSRRQLSYAQTCVRMAKKVVETSLDHQRRGLLCPASWPSVYTVFISVVCLVFAYATRKDDTDDPETKKDIEDGIHLLASTACTTDTGSVRCLEILRRLIARVSYAVDIDFVGICTRTNPGCTTVPNAGSRGETPPNLNELHVAQRHVSEAGRSSSASSFLPSATSSGPHWSLSPDITMTQPSFSEVRYATQLPEQSSSQAESDQMIDVPHGGMFNWHHMARHYADRGPVNQQQSQQSQRQQRGPSTSNMRLTAEDIAAFMHSNPLDE